ncbi:putative morc, S5 domain 2 protein [Helianthus anomalus]
MLTKINERTRPLFIFVHLTKRMEFLVQTNEHKQTFRRTVHELFAERSPFQPVVLFADSRGRGVIGVLEADFIEPTHNKQDFEKTSLFQKLVTRLKEMTWEYWDYHCGLIGYQIKKKPRPPSDTPGLSNFIHQHVEDYSRKRRNNDVGSTKKTPGIAALNSKAALYSSPSFLKPVELKQSFPPGFKEGSNLKRKLGDESRSFSSEVVNVGGSNLTDLGHDGGAIKVIDENKKLKAQCLEFEKAEEELTNKVAQLKRELGDAKAEYARILAELEELDVVKGEN